MLIVKGFLCGRMSMDSDQAVTEDFALSAGCLHKARKTDMDDDYDPENYEPEDNWEPNHEEDEEELEEMNEAEVP
jgi:hypothetical protein